MVDVRIRRIGPGPALVIGDAEFLVAHFIRHDASAQPGGYDDLAGRGERDRITRSDIVAINTTMRARSPHGAWEEFFADPRPLPWLAALDPAWDLIDETDEHWRAGVRVPVKTALAAATGPGRGISVGSKVLHLKRPAMFPVLDRLVLGQLGVAESVPIMRVVEHLRTEGRRNAAAIQVIREHIAPHRRSPVRILDVLIWASHPASGLGPTLGAWEHRFVRVDGDAPHQPSPAPGDPHTRSASRTSQATARGESVMARRDRTFEDVWDCLSARGGMRVVSSRGTEYRVTATESKGQRVLIARPRSGAVYVHADCFGQDVTCQGTRAGGIYNGSPSVWDC